MAKSYKDKLLDPRWQKKRLKVLERDNWECKWCGDKENTLHVHHKKYAKSGNPWDSPMEDLKTLCCNCHSIEEYFKKCDFVFTILKIDHDWTSDYMVLVKSESNIKSVWFFSGKDGEIEKIACYNSVLIEEMYKLTNNG